MRYSCGQHDIERTSNILVGPVNTIHIRRDHCNNLSFSQALKKHDFSYIGWGLKKSTENIIDILRTILFGRGSSMKLSSCQLCIHNTMIKVITKHVPSSPFLVTCCFPCLIS